MRSSGLRPGFPRGRRKNTWTKVWHCSVHFKRKYRSVPEGSEGWHYPLNLRNIHPHIYHDSQNTKLSTISIPVELVQLHPIDVDASNHLIVQPPCLRHCHKSVHPILNSSKPKYSLSYSSLMIPWQFRTKNIMHLKSGISLPAVWRCGLLHLNFKKMKSEESKISYYHVSKRNSQKSKFICFL